MTGSASRAVRLSFCDGTVCPVNAVQPGDPGYTAPASPPYWGTQVEAVRMENKCSLRSLDMHAMKAGDKFNCPTLIRLPNIGRTIFYRLEMMGDSTEPETQLVQVSCNAADSSGCNDWFIDPIPVVNADGSTSPGTTRARLNLVNTQGTSSSTNEGDFYLTFHIHVTRP